MDETRQARETIKKAIAAWEPAAGWPDGPPAAGSTRINAFAEAAGVSASMLYQFVRDEGPCLGPGTVRKVAPLLPAITRAEWFAAMGWVLGALPAADEAQAG